MKKILYLFAAATVAFASCDQYAEGDRYIENNEEGQGGGEPSAFTKRVLVEDFTGQACVNCPSAAAMFAQLKEETYGERMVLVGLHAGGLALGSPLYSETAQMYMDELNLKNNPAISVDRTYCGDGVATGWAAEIDKASKKTADMDITMAPVLNKETRELEVYYSVEFGKDIEEKLGVQLYLIESNIIDYQAVHGGYDPEYVHNHVFRMALNDTWGKELKGESGDIVYLNGETYVSKTAKVTLPENYNLDNCAVVGYVFSYPDDETKHVKEVLQANEVHL